MSEDRQREAVKVFVHAMGPATQSFRRAACEAAATLGHASLFRDEVGLHEPRHAGDEVASRCVIILPVGGGDPLPEPAPRSWA